MTIETAFSDDIQIDSFPMVQVLEFSMKHKQNDHAYIICSGIISEENHESYMEKMGSSIPVDVTVSKQISEDERITFFAGQVQDIQIHKRKGVYFLELEATSTTIIYDTQKKNRSFQQVGIDYDQLLKDVISPYPKAHVINTLAQGEKMNQFLVQYEETTWEFMKRLATRMGGSLVAHVQQAKPWFFFGLPNIPSQDELIVHDYDVYHDFIGYERLVKNTNLQISAKEYSNYVVESRQFHYLGDRVIFEGEKQQIIDVKRELTDGVLLNTYVLGNVQVTTNHPIINQNFRGLSLSGVVRAVRGDQVQIQLDIDEKEKSGYWFTYSTSHSSENNIGIYFMPDVGDGVRVYFPTTNEREAYAISAVRDENESELDPDIKMLKHASGAVIMIAPKAITIIHGNSSIVLDESSGITIQSDGSITISGKQNINIKGHQILMDAAEQIKLSVNHNSVTIDGAIVLSGTDVKMN